MLYLQTLINIVILLKPELFYQIPCRWNIQLWREVVPLLCSIAWSTAYDGEKPGIFHYDEHDKLEGVFYHNPVQGDLLDRKSLWFLI